MLGTGEEFESRKGNTRDRYGTTLLKKCLTAEQRASGLAAPNIVFPVRARIRVCVGLSLDAQLFEEGENQYWIRHTHKEEVYYCRWSLTDIESKL